MLPVVEVQTVLADSVVSMAPEGGANEERDRGQLLLALMLRMKQGDPEAMGPFYDATCRFVFGYAREVLRNPEDAEEVMIDVYATVWRHAHRFDPRHGGVLRWLALIVRSRAIDSLRARQLRRRTQGSVPLDSLARDLHPSEAALAQREHQAELNHGMQALQAAHRQVIELAFFEELTHTEISERLGLPLGTVKSRIRLGLKHLRNTLEKDSSNA